VAHTIALLTDFGTRDPYVAAMKMVIAARCEARIVDLTHEIAPFDVLEAAIFLQSIVGYLQPGRFIVVAVVDPGVGTERRILLAERSGQLFLAPDNGLLSLVVDDSTCRFAVERNDLFLPGDSATFHGRDRFAPVAAALARGLAAEHVGPAMATADMVRLDYTPPQARAGGIRGRVISIDRFGNIITDIPANPTVLARLTVVVKGKAVGNMARTYQEGRALNGPFAIIGSRGTIEISVANQSAAELLQIARFDPVEVHERT
jgi:S-adenosylmethionine hydrolase